MAQPPGGRGGGSGVPIPPVAQGRGGGGRGLGPGGPGGANPQTTDLPGGDAGDAGDNNLPVGVKKLFFSDDELELRESMMHYVLATPRVTVLPVPGYDAANARDYQQRSRRARRTSCALVTFFCDLNELGYALDGEFNSESFGIDQLGHLRGNFCLLSLVKEISATVDGDEDGVSKNMKGVANIIQYKIHSPAEIPMDLSQLLSTLNEYNITLSPLVRSHISHEEEDVKVSLFLNMHQRFKFLSKMEPTTYANILQGIVGTPGTPDCLGVWLQSAMLNIHLQCILRFKFKNRNLSTIYHVVYAFLTSKVQQQFVADDANGLVTCRRNGQSHMEPDGSVDTIGYLEAALFAAESALRTYHQTKYNADLAAGAQPLEPMASRVLEAIPDLIATVVAHGVYKFLDGCHLSLDAAKVGATTAANYLAVLLNVPNRWLTQQLIRNAVANGMAAAQVVQGGVAPAQIPLPIRMFTSIDMDHMFDVTAPKLLGRFQMAMFNEQQYFRLSNDRNTPRLTA